MKGLNRCIAAMFSGLVALILSVLFICFKETAFAWKREFVLPQWIMLLCGATVLGCFGMLLRNGIEKLRKWSLFAPWIAGAALLSVQLVICFHAYFITGWDVRSITESAYAFAGGESDYHSAYLSMYHNNIPITLFFAAIIRVLRFIFGNIGMDRCMYVLIAGQCILNTVTGLLCFFVALFFSFLSPQAVNDTTKTKDKINAIIFFTCNTSFAVSFYFMASVIFSRIRVTSA